MSDNAELHSKILAFLAGEFARKEIRQCTGVDLLYAPSNGYRDEEIRKWVRADEPELFENLVNVENLVTSIIEIAEGEADARLAGKHRFVIRTHQHGGSRPTMSFALSPGYRGGDDEAALVPSGGGSGGGGLKADVVAMQVLAGHSGQFMRINAQMFDSALRPLAQQNTTMLTEIITLREECSRLQRELDEARSNKMDREFQLAMAADKNARTNAGFQKLLQLGTVVAAKIGGGDNGDATTPLMMLVGEFGRSLRPDQMSVLTSKAIPIFMATLEATQKVMFIEIMNAVSSPEASPGEPKPDAGAVPPNGANGLG